MSKLFVFTEGMQSDDPLVAAKAYIKAGCRIVVTHGITEHKKCTCGQSECKAGKHPINKFFPKGAHSATDDINLVREALECEPDANIAIILDNLTVVDIDGPEGEKLIKELNLDETVVVKTGRGRHLYFTGEIEGGSFKATQVDVLTGNNRYVMMPPSIHPSGKQYTVQLSKVSAAASVPASLNSLRKTKTTKKGGSAAQISEGERNDALFRIARGLPRQIRENYLSPVLNAINAVACKTPLPEAEIKSIVASCTRYDNQTEAMFGPSRVRESLPQEFLWYPYIPKHAPTIPAGDPGRGKSLLIALLISIITRGENLPLTRETASGNRVLLLSAEDSWARVTLKRLEKAGFNIDNLHIMRRFYALTDECLKELESHMREWRPDLVVIDTLSAYMGSGRDMHRQNEVGEFLGRLNEIAEETDSAVVGLAHLNKSSSEHPLYRIVGSIGFAATIRSALFLGADPDDPSRLALAHGKPNGTEKGRTVIFERVGGGRDEPPVLKAVGYSDADEVDVCRNEKGPVGRPSVENEAAAEFILSQLCDKPKEWSKVKRMAEAQSIASESTMNAVRANLAKEGRIEQVGKGKAAMWILAAETVD